MRMSMQDCESGWRRCRKFRLVVLDQSVLVFDTHSRRKPRSSSGIHPHCYIKPIRYVVNSHWHAIIPWQPGIFRSPADRSVNTARCDAARFAVAKQDDQDYAGSAENLRQSLAKESDAAIDKRLREQIKTRQDYLQTISQLKISAPFVTLDDNLKMQEGKQEVQLMSLGAGHTEGDIILFLPELKIAFVGDLFFNKAIRTCRMPTFCNG